MTSKLSAMFFPGDDSKKEKGIDTLGASGQVRRLTDLGDIGSSDRRSETPENRECAEYSQQPNVRFASQNEEIDPIDDSRRKIPQTSDPRDEEELTPETQEQIRNLAMSLQKSRLQENRMSNFAYEAVSMPPSRVCGSLHSQG